MKAWTLWFTFAFLFTGFLLTEQEPFWGFLVAIPGFLCLIPHILYGTHWR